MSANASNTSNKIDYQAAATIIASWMRNFFLPGEVTELRALRVSRASYRKEHTEAGFFDYEHFYDMAFHALQITHQAKGVYFVMNPLNRNLLARRSNRVEFANSDFLACDKDVLFRRWILIDCDPIRDPLVSATDEEKAAALETCLAVRAYLAGQSWQEPIFADSGNGYHLFYRVNMPRDDKSEIKRCLNALGEKFDGPLCKVDRKVFNPSRIVKFPGTMANKGDDVPSRPHRRARLLSIPGMTALAVLPRMRKGPGLEMDDGPVIGLEASETGINVVMATSAVPTKSKEMAM